MNTKNSDTLPSGNAKFQIMVAKMSENMNFVGITNIICGAIVCLSIIGTGIGIPLIIGGVRLREAARSFEAYLRSKDFEALEKGLERQGRFFSMQTVFLVILGLYILFIIPFFLYFETLSND